MPWLTRHIEDVGLILAMSLLSGCAQFWMNVRSGTERFGIAALIGELVISASASLICGCVLLDYFSTGIVIAASGVAGHMGTRFIFAAEKVMSDRLRARLDTKP